MTIALQIVRIIWLVLWTVPEILSLLIMAVWGLLHLGIMYLKYWKYTRRILEEKYHPFNFKQ